jgi:hypothetical protein
MHFASGTKYFWSVSLLPTKVRSWNFTPRTPHAWDTRTNIIRSVAINQSLSAVKLESKLPFRMQRVFKSKCFHKPTHFILSTHGIQTVKFGCYRSTLKGPLLGELSTSLAVPLLPLGGYSCTSHFPPYFTNSVTLAVIAQ